MASVATYIVEILIREIIVQREEQEIYDGDNNRVFQIDNTYKWEDCYGEEVLIPESQRTEDGNSPQE